MRKIMLVETILMVVTVSLVTVVVDNLYMVYNLLT